MTVTGLALIALGVVVVVAFAWAAVRSRRRGREHRPPYIVALGALVDGDEDTALRELKNAVRTDSSNVDAYLRLADLFRRRGDVNRAYHIHRELASRGGIPRDLRARIQKGLCRDHLTLGRFDRAEEAAREAARFAPDDATALDLLLEVTEHRGDIEGGFKAKRDILKREGRAKDGSFELAEFRAGQARPLLEKGQLKEAEKILRDARKLDARSPAAKLLWGELQERQGNYGAAIEAWNSFLKDRPEDVETIFRNLERVHFLHGTFSEMEATYHEYLDAVPGHEDAAFGLSRFLQRKGQVDDALDVARRTLGTHPASPKLRVLHLALLLQSGRAGEAEAVLNEWISEGLGEGSGDEEDIDSSLVESSS